MFHLNAADNEGSRPVDMKYHILNCTAFLVMKNTCIDVSLSEMKENRAYLEKIFGLVENGSDILEVLHSDD